jgi:Rps23 Pro-64 3,4-dihydroxylase Tpa1-like proline 4-hydroxylase
LFQYLCSQEFVEFVKDITGIQNLYPDYGLHGGGWHMHGKGGNLNVHKDYSIHPKLNLQRKLNLIIYLSKDWDTSWGGGLELWSHNQDTNRPLKKEKVVECIYNRAVLFDTTQNSWHGLPNHLTCPENEYRKSLAIYYLTDPVGKVEERTRALYAPREEQEADSDILNLIQKRSM